VAESDAQPGADDPRLHARLLASALLARLLEQSTADTQRAQALMRQLKQLHVLSSPGRLCVLTWDALDASLGLGAATGDTVDAGNVGLIALSGAAQSTEALLALVRARSERGAERRVAYKLHELVFDGKAFSVKVTNGQAG
jgi:hypothetical protein